MVVVLNAALLSFNELHMLVVRPKSMATKLYIGNLVYEAKDQDLRDLFGQFGEIISAEIVTYRRSKRSKGFGYVTFADDQAAQNAMQQMNQQDYKGRKLIIDVARAKKFEEGDEQKKTIPATTAGDNGQAAGFTPVTATPLADRNLDPSHELPAYESDPSTLPVPTNQIPEQPITSTEPYQAQQQQQEQQDYQEQQQNSDYAQYQENTNQAQPAEPGPQSPDEVKQEVPAQAQNPVSSFFGTIFSRDGKKGE